MLFYELIKPGTWINSEDKEFQEGVKTLLNNIIANFYDANISLIEFKECYQSIIESTKKGISPMKEYMRKYDELKYDFIREHPEYGLYENRDNLNMQITMMLNRTAWRSGKLPRDFPSAKMRIFARSFVYAIDGVEKALTRLSQPPLKTEGIETLLNQHQEAFRTNKDVRDSAHHQEDRARFIGKHNKKFKAKSLPNGLSYGEGQVLTAGLLIGNSLTYTSHTGENLGVEISDNTMNKLQYSVQSVLEFYEWIGPPVYYPELHEWV